MERAYAYWENTNCQIICRSKIYVSNDLIQAANKEFFNFIWKGKDKIKRFALINDIEYGGLKMMDLESKIRAQRIMCLKKYIDDYNPPIIFT